MHSSFSRRLLSLLLALIVVCSALPALGEIYPYAAFATDSVRLRQQPSPTARILAVIPEGDAVLITGETGNYYIVTYEGRQGFVQRDFLSAQTAPAPGPIVTPLPETAPSPYPLLYSGSRGSEVRALQEALQELSFYRGRIDGIFGQGTKDAVAAFQKMNGLPVTGSADGPTQQLLYEGRPRNSRGQAVKIDTLSPLAGATIESGSRGEGVSKLQARLQSLAYYDGSIDGICGRGTVAAIRAFQKKNGLSVTGKADAATQNLLYSAAALGAHATPTPRPTRLPTELPTQRPGPTPKPSFPFTTYTLVSVNLRRSASTSSTRLLSIPKGQEITVFAIEDDFLKVEYQGKQGYIVSEFAHVPPQYLPGDALKPDLEAQSNYPFLMAGSQGPHVQVVQEALTELDFYSGRCDGQFGPGTVTAVKEFQKKNRLKQDGTATPEMQKLLLEGRPLNARGRRTTVRTLPLIEGIEMRLHDRGQAVMALQEKLKQQGCYDGPLTPVFDSATQQAVRKFQKEHNLFVDGVAGAKTQRLLNALTATPRPTAYPSYPDPLPAQPTNTPLTEDNVIVMYNGTRGMAVKRLQERLMELEYYRCQPDGIYDSDDIAAVREFQRKNGLKADGIAGLDTQLVLYSDRALPATSVALPTRRPLPTEPPIIATPAPSLRTMRVGSRGQDVFALQTRLLSLGYASERADGIYGPNTAKAVKRFQQANNLHADGIAGAKTLECLYGSGGVPAVTPRPEERPPVLPDPPAKLLKMGDRGEDVRQLQRRLADLGYQTSVDGIYGPRTSNAVSAFQKRNRLTVDGIAGKMTLNRLFSDKATPAENTTPPSPVQPTTPPLDPIRPGPQPGGFRVPDPAEVRYANWFSEIRSRARLMPDVVIYDPDSGLHFNLHMFSFGKHADSEPPTEADTEILYQINGKGNWDPKYVWVIFPDGRVYIASLHSNGHSVDHNDHNGMTGHICLHFPRIMSEAELTGPYAVRHQKEILMGWEITQAQIR